MDIIPQFQLGWTPVPSWAPGRPRRTPQLPALRKLQSSWGRRVTIQNRGAQWPCRGRTETKHRSCAPCPKPVGLLYVPGAPAHWQAGGCESVSTTFGCQRFPGHHQLQGEGPNNRVSTSGSVTAPMGTAGQANRSPLPSASQPHLNPTLIQPPLGCPRGPSSALLTITSGGSWNLPRVTGKAVG